MRSSSAPASVEFVVKRDLCIGCGVCEAACPHNAIKMVYSYARGTYLPLISRGACSKCQLCLRVCPGYYIHVLHASGRAEYELRKTLRDVKKVYIGYARNNKLRFLASSGGVVTAILLDALKEGYIDGVLVTLLRGGITPIAKGVLARTEEDVILSMGSKYMPSLIGSALKELKPGSKYIVVGLPCHIYAVRKFIEIRREFQKSDFYFLGLLCGGLPNINGTLRLLRNYVKDDNQLFITELKHRGLGWPGYLYAIINNKRKIILPYMEYSQRLFLPFQHNICQYCILGFNSFADISVGDAWLPELITKEKKGISIVLLWNSQGAKLLRFTSDALNLQNVKLGTLWKSQRGLIYKYKTMINRIALLSFFIHYKIPHFGEVSFKKIAIEMISRIGFLLARYRLYWLLTGYELLLKSLSCSMPEPKSRYSFPSTSLTQTPSASNPTKGEVLVRDGERKE